MYKGKLKSSNFFLNSGKENSPMQGLFYANIRQHYMGLEN
jgi:hypothetical protein